uniref:Organic solute transporter alpha-like protein 3 n=1 Tax=Parastrongyloides trichosuri TaxID=131310 RepID=A0A0N4ZCC0_PARTI
MPVNIENSTTVSQKQDFMDLIYDTAVKLISGTFLNCSHNPVEIPKSGDFLSKLDTTYLLALIICSVICIITVIMCLIHVSYVYIYVTNSNRRFFILYLAGTAPFCSIAALGAMIAPRIWFLSHILSFFYFSIGLWLIICLMMHIVEGRQAVVKKMSEKNSKINLQTPPFCCVFPCLPKFSMETKKIRILEAMVFQSPCIRLIATLLSLALAFEDPLGSGVALKIIDFLTLPSLLLGIYGCHILVTTISKLEELMPFRYIAVFRILDIFFMFYGTQQPVFDFIARIGVFKCGNILPPLESAFFWKNALIVIESFIVSLISTILLKPSRSALFDKYPSVRSVVSSTIEKS